MKTAALKIIPLLAIAFCLPFASGLNAYSQKKTAVAPKIHTEMLVTTKWLASHLKDKQVFILHVARDRQNYDEGHIPGARFLSLGSILTTRDGISNELPNVEKLINVFEALGIGDQGKIIIYGDNNGLSASRAFFTLDYLGHGHRLALLDGGLEKWKASGLQLETETAKFETARFTPRLSADVLTSFEIMLDQSWVTMNVPDSGVAIIDARPQEQFAGIPNQRSGHIPGAANVFWMQHLTSANDLTLKPATELRKLYEAVGLKPDQKVVTYCNTGMQASQTYFTLKYLGYKVSMYDGSFSEWSKSESAPILTGNSRK